MTPFELIYLALEPFLPPIYQRVRKRLLSIAKPGDGSLDILDVGGRKSHYTIGLPARVTISDLPRESDIQERLNLGLNESLMQSVKRRRSNVRDMVIDDMTKSAFPDSSFGCVVAVEVLEHVADDDLFVKQVHRVLKPGGVFLMTTPNGEYLSKFGAANARNPSNHRWYTKSQVAQLLSGHFETVHAEYAIARGHWRTLGLQPWSARHPWRTLKSMFGNLVNAIESSRASVPHSPHSTRHLIAVARKQSGQSACR